MRIGPYTKVLPFFIIIYVVNFYSISHAFEVKHKRTKKNNSSELHKLNSQVNLLMNKQAQNRVRVFERIEFIVKMKD